MKDEERPPPLESLTRLADFARKIVAVPKKDITKRLMPKWRRKHRRRP